MLLLGRYSFEESSMSVTALVKEDALIKAVRQHIARSSTFHVAMALASATGLEQLLPDLQAALKRGSTGEFLFGTDLPTHPEAIAALQDLVGQHLTSFTVKRFASPAARAFHAKLWVFGDTAAIVGSSNLTGGGLAANYEANVLIEDRQAISDLAAQFEAMFHGAYATPVTPDWFAAYRAAWQERKDNLAEAARLRERTRKEPDPAPRRRTLPKRIKGNTFVFTGRIHDWPRPSRLYPYVEKLGGFIGMKASALPTAAALVQGELMGFDDTLKLRTARGLGSLIITQDEFFEIAEAEEHMKR